MKDSICGYDSFKLFIPGQQVINYLIQQADKFNLYGRYSVHREEQYKLPLNGEYIAGDHNGQE